MRATSAPELDLELELARNNDKHVTTSQLQKIQHNGNITNTMSISEQRQSAPVSNNKLNLKQRIRQLEQKLNPTCASTSQQQQEKQQVSDDDAAYPDDKSQQQERQRANSSSSDRICRSVVRNVVVNDDDNNNNDGDSGDDGGSRPPTPPPRYSSLAHQTPQQATSSNVCNQMRPETNDKSDNSNSESPQKPRANMEYIITTKHEEPRQQQQQQGSITGHSVLHHQSSHNNAHQLNSQQATNAMQRSESLHSEKRLNNNMMWSSTSSCSPLSLSSSSTSLSSLSSQQQMALNGAIGSGSGGSSTDVGNHRSDWQHQYNLTTTTNVIVKRPQLIVRQKRVSQKHTVISLLPVTPELTATTTTPGQQPNSQQQHQHQLAKQSSSVSLSEVPSSTTNWQQSSAFSNGNHLPSNHHHHRPYQQQEQQILGNNSSTSVNNLASTRSTQSQRLHIHNRNNPGQQQQQQQHGQHRLPHNNNVNHNEPATITQSNPHQAISGSNSRTTCDTTAINNNSADVSDVNQHFNDRNHDRWCNQRTVKINYDDEDDGGFRDAAYLHQQRRRENEELLALCSASSKRTAPVACQATTTATPAQHVHRQQQQQMNKPSACDRLLVTRPLPLNVTRVSVSPYRLNSVPKSRSQDTISSSSGSSCQISPVAPSNGCLAEPLSSPTTNKREKPSLPARPSSIRRVHGRGNAAAQHHRETSVTCNDNDTCHNAIRLTASGSVQTPTASGSRNHICTSDSSRANRLLFDRAQSITAATNPSGCEQYGQFQASIMSVLDTKYTFLLVVFAAGWCFCWLVLASRLGNTHSSPSNKGFEDVDDDEDEFNVDFQRSASQSEHRISVRSNSRTCERQRSKTMHCHNNNTDKNKVWHWPNKADRSTIEIEEPHCHQSNNTRLQCPALQCHDECHQAYDIDSEQLETTTSCSSQHLRQLADHHYSGPEFHQVSETEWPSTSIKGVDHLNGQVRCEANNTVDDATANNGTNGNIEQCDEWWNQQPRALKRIHANPMSTSTASLIDHHRRRRGNIAACNIICCPPFLQVSPETGTGHLMIRALIKNFLATSSMGRHALYNRAGQCQCTHLCVVDCGHAHWDCRLGRRLDIVRPRRTDHKGQHEGQHEHQ
ncbi:hypothetical protein GZH46_00786, partial [Fragariocoptes setiger]